jgi:hypothetical protein
MIHDPIDDGADARVDLSSLAAGDDPTRLDDRIRAIVRDGLLARQHSVSSILGQWLRPALAAAALIAVALLPMIARLIPQRTPQRATSTAEILGVPPALIDLVASTPQPSVVDVVQALNAETERPNAR